VRIKDPNADLSQKKGEGEEEMAPIDKVSHSLAHEQFVLFCFPVPCLMFLKNAHPVSPVGGSKDRVFKKKTLLTASPPLAKVSFKKHYNIYRCFSATTFTTGLNLVHTPAHMYSMSRRKL
jgi:hypothetical protein